MFYCTFSELIGLLINPNIGRNLELFGLLFSNYFQTWNSLQYILRPLPQFLVQLNRRQTGTYDANSNALNQ
ncbi:hypothetical protein PHET_05581 [Paragonimus heterotremus]|uniref:Uncharacterized protein n=1 Tax=Paragonimus heterotremus TaxID=100268 RepID=A0A8J4WGT0_9TREM|nr:hypothetical protein PHET_05581 [Paragonimus heterotremus]